MKHTEVMDKLHKALNLLSKNDLWLLRNNLNERTIAHKLAEYLQQLFPEYNVDCEYNRDVEQQTGFKKLNILKESYEEIKNTQVNGLSIDVSVFPDIIVHRRGTNNFNLLVVELKKTTNTNKIAKDFDIEKLHNYTDLSERNTLKYNFGVFIILETHQNRATQDNFISYIQWF